MKTIDLRKTITSDEIELNLEYKLKGIRALLDCMEASSDMDIKYPAEGFSLLGDMLDNLLNDLQPIKTKIDYTFNHAVHGNLN